MNHFTCSGCVHFFCCSIIFEFGFLCSLSIIGKHSLFKHFSKLISKISLIFSFLKTAKTFLLFFLLSNLMNVQSWSVLVPPFFKGNMSFKIGLGLWMKPSPLLFYFFVVYIPCQFILICTSIWLKKVTCTLNPTSIWKSVTCSSVDFSVLCLMLKSHIAWLLIYIFPELKFPLQFFFHNSILNRASIVFL